MPAWRCACCSIEDVCWRQERCELLTCTAGDFVFCRADCERAMLFCRHLLSCRVDALDSGYSEAISNMT